MPAEKFANRPSSTVAVGYTATDLTIEVADASDFPSTGVFRVILGNTEQTIFIVDSVAGDVFTGAAEAFDGNAAIGVTVKIVASKAAAERFIQSPDDGVLIAPSGLSGADGYGPLFKMKALDQSGYSWVNQGSAAVVQGGGVVKFTGQHVAGATAIRGRVTTIPSTPFTLVAGIVPFFPPATNLANLAAFGIGFRESGTTKMVCSFVGNFDYLNGNALSSVVVVHGFTNPTTGATLYVQKRGGIDYNAHGVNRFLPPFGIVWLRVIDDGTDVTYSWSWDKVTWNALITQTRVTGFTTAPDEIGFFSQLQSANVTIADLAWIVSWELS